MEHTQLMTYQPWYLLTRVAPAGGKRLALAFGDGFRTTVDLADIIGRHPTLAPLQNPDIFARVALDEWARGVVFDDNDDLQLASDNLRALAIEQAGGYSHQQVIEWMHKHDLTLDEAAEALGLSRRMLAYYRSGEKPIPKTVGLAMLGWEYASAA